MLKALTWNFQYASDGNFPLSYIQYIMLIYMSQHLKEAIQRVDLFASDTSLQYTILLDVHRSLLLLC